MEKYLKIKKICCIGAGYVGGPTMAVIADKCPHINVTVIDKDSSRIEMWNDNNLDKLPIYEPGLKEIIKRVRNKNLFFSVENDSFIKEADAIFISVNTPIKSTGLGAGKASNLYWVEKCARKIAKTAEGYTIVIEKSTLPVRTAEIIKKILNSSIRKNTSKNSPTFSVLSNPEFLAEGTAINDLKNPDRVLIGGEDDLAIKSLYEVYSFWVNPKKIITTNLWSSELSKLVANAFLAQRISSINSISQLCETTGASITEVAKAIGSDKRIGKSFLNAGPGFGGSCFKKDIFNLVYLCRNFGLNEIADFWEQVVFLNEWQQNRIYKIIVEKLFNTVEKKKLVILGFSFKANTNDTRESPAIKIANFLLSEGARLTIHDPKVTKEQISRALDSSTKKVNFSNTSKIKCWEFENSIYKALDGADAIILLTEWDEYKSLNWKKISKNLSKPAWVFDTRLILDKNKITQNGINFWSVGKG